MDQGYACGFDIRYHVIKDYYVDIVFLANTHITLHNMSSYVQIHVAVDLTSTIISVDVRAKSFGDVRDWRLGLRLWVLLSS